jgi:hypothetical protein
VQLYSDHIIVVAKDIHQPLNGDLKHLQLVPQTLNQLYCYLHCNKFRTKSCTFDSVLLLSIPDDRRAVTVNEDTGMQPLHHPTAPMIGVNKAEDPNGLPLGLVMLAV